MSNKITAGNKIAEKESSVKTTGKEGMMKGVAETKFCKVVLERSRYDSYSHAVDLFVRAFVGTGVSPKEACEALARWLQYHDDWRQ